MEPLDTRVTRIETDVAWIRQAMEKGHTCVQGERFAALEAWNRIYKRILVSVAVGIPGLLAFLVKVGVINIKT